MWTGGRIATRAPRARIVRLRSCRAALPKAQEAIERFCQLGMPRSMPQARRGIGVSAARRLARLVV